MTHPSSSSTNARSGHSAFLQFCLAACGLILFLGFFALGTWQLYRLQWKLDLIARVDARLHSRPIALPPAAQWPQLDMQALEYQPVQVQGQWLPEKTVLSQALTQLGAGFWLLSALQLPDGSVVWVNRGFIPQALHLQWRQPAYLRAHSPAGQVSISGLVRKSEPKGGFLRRNQPALQQWHSRDVAAMAQALQLPHAAPFFVDAGLPSKQRLPDAQAAGEQPRQSLAQLQAQDWPRAGLTEVHFRNPHLVYALTWYALAAMVLGAAWIVRRYRRRQ